MININKEEITRNWNNSNNIPLVSISCPTYNHALYIEQCLDGFLMQKTNFPFEILIHDDCSTDGTTEIIKKYESLYPDIIKPMYENENQYQQGKPSGTDVWNLPRAKGKYITICEGDDFWIDENKLQMQVDYLETHHDIGLLYTYSKVFLQDQNRISKDKIGSPFVSYEDVFINGNCVPTLTLCMRTELYKKYILDIPIKDKKNWKMGDLPICLWFIKNSKIHLIPKVTAMYRVLSESASHSNDTQKMAAFNQSIYDIREYFAKKYDDMELLHQFDINNKINIAWKERNRNEFLTLYKEFRYPSRILKVKNIIFRSSFLYHLFMLIKGKKSV